MKITLKLACIIALLCCCASIEAEEYPDKPGLWGINPGVYSTYEGTMLPSRMTESWVGDSLDYYVPGNVISIMSWDGDSLGSQWRVWDATADSDGAIITDYSIDPNGIGFINYTVNYDGGWVWFNKDHFGDGTIDLGGWVTYMNSGIRMSYVDSNLMGVTSNVLIAGRLNNCPGCVFEIAITNAFNIWNPESTDPMPEGYPPYSDNALTGGLWELCCSILNIDCHTDMFGNPYCIQIGTETSSWGKIKKIHR